MNYIDFRNRTQALPIIFSRDLARGKEDKQAILNQLERWRAKKLIIQLRRGVYVLNPNDAKINPSRAYIANQLYSPSYVSTEYALGYYGLIPEKVADMTSVSTKKTARFSNQLGEFVYQNIKPAAFRGFRSVRDEAGLGYFIAEPEKALVDFVHLNLSKFDPGDVEIFRESYRLQNIETLAADRITGYARLFGSDKLVRVARSLVEFIRKEGAG